MLTVQNPADGEQFEIDLAAENRTLATETVTIDALTFNASSQQDLELTLTTTSTPTETTPNQTVPAQSDVTLGYLSAENGSAVENVSFEFTLDEEALSEQNAPPETVVFHRYNETTETWVAKNTTLQNRSNGELRYETVVESFSEWALTADRPEITVTDAQLETTTAQPGESVAVDVTVTNDGHASGNETVELLADGQVVTSETVSLDGEETQQITLTTTFDDVGEYDVAVEETDSGIVTIQSETTTPSEPRTPTDGTDESTDTSDPDTDTGPSNGDGSGFPWWAVGAVVVIGGLIAAAVLRYREGGTEE
jgi:PGF-pre-PGF domain-containing protein